MNNTLGRGKKVDDATMADRFFEVVCELGSEPRQDLKVEMLTSAAEGDLAKTCKCIRKVLGDIEAVADKAEMIRRKNERANFSKDGTDPNKTTSPATGR